MSAETTTATGELEAKARTTPLRRAIGVGLVAVATAMVSGYVAGGHAADAPTRTAARALGGRVARIVGDGVTVEGRPATAGTEVVSGAVVATDGRSRARVDLGDGSSVVLDRATRLELTHEARTTRVLEGAVLADVAEVAGAPPFRLRTANGDVEVRGTKVSVTATAERTNVDVLRGEVRVVTSDGRAEVIAAGHEAVATPDGRIDVAPANDLAHRAAFGASFVSEHEEDAEASVSGLGELRARRPGRSEEKDHAVRLARHAVKIRIAGSVARTEIDEEFRNDTDDELEGIYRFPLPPGAQIERLALEVDGNLVDGEFVDRTKAQAIWRGAIHHAAPKTPKPREEIVWVPGPWHDPALLEWQRGGRFELRIFPIPKRGARRVVLAYTETLAPSSGLRRYVYPLPEPTSSGLAIESFTVDARVTGHDPQAGVRVRGYELARSEADGATQLRADLHGFAPSGDLAIDYALPAREQDLTAVAYLPAGEKDAYASLAIRPRLPRMVDGRARDQVLVVDVGRTMFGERLRRARRLAVQLASEMDRRDRLTVLACDVTCREMPGGFVSPGATGAHDVDAFLAGTTADGASDLVGAVEAAASLTSRDRARDLRVTLLTGGLATAGHRAASRVADETRRALSDPRAAVVAVPVGTEADQGLLEELVRGGAGVIVPYAPGQKLEGTALDVLAATYGVALRDVTVELPEGLHDVAPEALPSVRGGSELRVLGRLRGASVRGDVVLRGLVGEERFEARYPLALEASTSAGNAFVPRLFAAARIHDLERKEDSEGTRRELVALSRAHAVPSRQTALLVLESEAMFRAFGVERAAHASTFSGETAAQTVETQALDAPPGDAASGMDDLLAAKEKKASSVLEPESPWASRQPRSLGGGMGRAMPAPAPTTTAPAPKPVRPIDPWADRRPPENPWRREREGRFMRRIWVRAAAFDTSRAPAVTDEKIDVARRAAEASPDDRSKHVELARLLALGDRLDELDAVLGRWAERDPLDADMLAARADLAARRGDRALALRILGGLLASPSLNDVDAARLARALGRSHERVKSPATCAFYVVAAERRPSDVDSVARAVRCEGERGRRQTADALGSSFTGPRRALLDKAVRAAGASGSVTGDVVVAARWTRGVDLDVSLIDPRGRRAGVVSALDAQVEDGTSLERERVGLASSQAGTFLVEIARAEPGASRAVTGVVVLRAAGQTREVPFTFTGERVRVARVDVRWRPELVPIEDDLPFAR